MFVTDGRTSVEGVRLKLLCAPFGRGRRSTEAAGRMEVTSGELLCAESMSRI